MSYDMEHTVIYTKRGAAVITDSKVRVIGDTRTDIYLDDDGSFIISVRTAKSDLDPAMTHIVHIDREMFASMVNASVRRTL